MDPSSTSCDDPDCSPDAAAQQTPDNCQASGSKHEDGYDSDDDHFSDVGDAPDTEVGMPAPYWSMMEAPRDSHTFHRSALLLAVSHIGSSGSGLELYMHANLFCSFRSAMQVS